MVLKYEEEFSESLKKEYTLLQESIFWCYLNTFIIDFFRKIKLVQ